jgi:hypothetical protein
MKMFGGPASINLKVLLLILAIFIAIGTFFYTHHLVNKLQKKDKQIVELYAKGLEYLVNVEDNSSNLTFIFENIIKPIDFPLILTDKNDIVNIQDKKSIRNLSYDTTLSQEKQVQYIKEKLNDMDAINPPIVIAYKDSIIFGKIHYGDSNLIKQLRYYPYLQIFAAAMFILIGYISFSNIKKREQSNIWVGMAKETAHQLGTPISSLMGWTEILNLNFNNPDKVLDVTEEIHNDLERLKKITQRFSKIGSHPELKEISLSDVISKIIKYFDRRLPQIGKNVTLTVDGADNVRVKLNPELFEWVLENLIKNALDAIEGKTGNIKFSVVEKNKTVEIEVTDTGKGIEFKRRKDVFRPGYSTKKRGWGLGLSLSKRIVEEYHKGKIFVKNSSQEGTTFKIILNKN